MTAIETADFLPHRPEIMWHALTDPCSTESSAARVDRPADPRNK
jgi:hypothetical protein